MPRNRYIETAAKYLPHHVKVTFIKTGYASADVRAQQMDVFTPRDADTLYSFLHEVAHLNFHIISNRPRYLEEFQANLWAEKIIYQEGIKIPRWVMKRQRRYVADCIIRAFMHGAKAIDPKALSYTRCAALGYLKFLN